MAHVIIQSKEHRFIPECEIYVGDGLSGSFVDADYRMAGAGANISNAAKQINTYGIGTFVKIRFNRRPEKTTQNPCA